MRGAVRGDEARRPLLLGRLQDVRVQTAPSVRRAANRPGGDDPRPGPGDGHDQEPRKVRSPAGEARAGGPAGFLRGVVLFRRPPGIGRRFAAWGSGPRLALRRRLLRRVFQTQEARILHQLREVHPFAVHHRTAGRRVCQPAPGVRIDTSSM